ncbi:hypothetical protein BCV69DRAFT_174298 [Microstroma glucosiphilum]|uniref:Uncharacterized protein n=1 Tax=Pseudomicrostroma glucosiphilum TaxID=1684307 RepID=A0A316U9S7_9BASI|nr:hypothetical protein BCV69DRAFT_174298 [Pseudomicrostroma glucosiphilum]PWN21574.1 hypothetical protein BCV69DRAFT_174298 [Pseudomicrostroma glucosiphilum]
MQLIASCAGVPSHRILSCFKGISHVLPDRVGDIKGDEPLLHIDQVVSFFQRQVSLDPRAASSSKHKLLTESAPPLLLTPQHLKVLSPLKDFDELRRLARSLTDQLIATEPLYTAVYGSQKTRVSPGEWAYFMVLWAIGGLLKKRLPGSEWIKRDLIEASLGGMVTPVKKECEIPGSDDEAGGNTSEEDGLSNLQDVSPSHITQYTEIGQVIAHRAMELPWVTTLQQGGNRRKKNSGSGGGRAARIKEGTEVQYITELADFGISLSHSHFSEDRKDLSRKAKRPLGGVGPPLDPSPSAVGITASTPALLAHPHTNDSLGAAAGYLASLASDDSALRNGNASYTSLHHPALVGEGTLIDTMSDETADALLFGPGEMASYLRSQGEIAALSKIKVDSGDWKEEPTSSDNADALPVKRHKAAGRGPRCDVGRGRESSITPSVPALVSHSPHGPTARRTKADDRLLAAARGDLAGFIDRPAGPPSRKDDARASQDSRGD